jgi:hypothetical protein
LLVLYILMESLFGGTVRFNGESVWWYCTLLWRVCFELLYVVMESMFGGTVHFNGESVLWYCTF